MQARIPSNMNRVSAADGIVSRISFGDVSGVPRHRRGSYISQGRDLMVPQIKMFLYFAYGSNLLASRMLIQNPTAKRIGPACSADHRLDFNFESKRWGGNAATIVPDLGKHVWGALWQVDNIENLDDQEGVKDGVYFAKQVFVKKPDNTTVECRSYQLLRLPQADDRKKPSRVYLETIIQGAVETGLPFEYIQQLKKIEHNGFEGPIKIPGFNISFVETKN